MPPEPPPAIHAHPSQSGDVPSADETAGRALAEAARAHARIDDMGKRLDALVSAVGHAANEITGDAATGLVKMMLEMRASFESLRATVQADLDARVSRPARVWAWVRGVAVVTPVLLVVWAAVGWISRHVQVKP